MKKYRNIEIPKWEVDAIQWTGGNIEDLKDFFKDDKKYRFNGNTVNNIHGNCAIIKYDELSTMTVRPTAYICRNTTGFIGNILQMSEESFNLIFKEIVE